MKVFGIGLSKTGTTTLGAALGKLGLKHLPGPEWESIFSWHTGDMRGLRQRAEKFQAFEDWPWPLVYREVDQWFPDAKFILTLRRDPETWFRSSCDFRENLGPSTLREIIFGFPMPSEDNKNEHISFYINHNSSVQSYFGDRPGKLLTVCWEDGASWSEICRFLNIASVPTRPFPHLNKTHSARTRTSRLVRIARRVRWHLLTR